ncbi:hypothetical protein MKW94_026509 [Papaver nudicaule]|uniref:Uncharacterized protein n=1 Tax=Papaver nudicaule TaxID=74823 RepID=A0AA41VDW5_PAPNU|nr:hypothetical protein [Papaver nudicaule]
MQSGVLMLLLHLAKGYYLNIYKEEVALRTAQKMKVENGGSSIHVAKIPWKKIMPSLPVWVIVVNNFTFHHALYVLMNWFPTFFEPALKISLQDMGCSKMLPTCHTSTCSYFQIYVGIISVTRTRNFLHTVGFAVASLALMALPRFRTSDRTVFCSSVALGIVMGISNTAGTLASIVGVGLAGKLVGAAKSTNSELSSPESWRILD